MIDQAIGQLGGEIIRVKQADRRTKVVRENQLQSKGHASHFQETVVLTRGTVDLSDLNLIHEHCNISQPHVPISRTVVPAHKPSGDPLGTVIINTDMRSVFAELNASFGIGDSLYVTNDRGDFLVHPDLNRTFGFEFSARHVLQGVYPDAAPQHRMSASSR